MLVSYSQITSFLQNYLNEHAEERDFLMNYQRVIVDYFNSDAFKNHNLLLLFMEVGSGKTLTSLACGIEGIHLGKFNKIIILSPKSVQDEFNKNFELYYYLSKEKDKSDIKEKIIMIPYNAYNAAAQFLRIRNLENSLIIIDEAHIFMKSIVKVRLNPHERNGDVGNAKRIYDKLLKLNNKKIICLTGTPISKHPFEIAPMFNLDGCDFPNTFDEFDLRYIENGHIIRKQEIINKIKGLVAYVKTDSSKQGLKVSPLNEINVEMGIRQYKQYLIDYEKELNESGFSPNKNVFGYYFGKKSSFHAKTFQDCIYYNPNCNIDRFADKDKIIIDEIHAPKIVKMYKDSEKINGLCVFYFRFVRLYGIDAMEQKLKEEGYEIVRGNPFEQGMKKRYVKFTGLVSQNTRNLWKNYFNDKRNAHGEFIKYLLLSPSGSVGLTLKNVKFLGIGSVEFNYSIIRQIMGRVNRLNSHIDLPLKERVLINNIYIMTKNMHFYKKHKKFVDELCERTAPFSNEKAPSIERCIFNDSIYDDIIIEEFRDCLIKASII